MNQFFPPAGVTLHRPKSYSVLSSEQTIGGRGEWPPLSASFVCLLSFSQLVTGSVLHTLSLHALLLSLIPVSPFYHLLSQFLIFFFSPFSSSLSSLSTFTICILTFLIFFQSHQCNVYSLCCCDLLSSYSPLISSSSFPVSLPPP